VESGKSDLGVFTLEEIDDELDDGVKFTHIVQEFTDLGKTHQGGVLVSPIVDLDHLQDQARKQRKDLLVEGFDNTINETRAEPGGGVLGFSFNVFNITFRRTKPFVFGFFVGGNHINENKLSNFLGGVLVESFNSEDEGFEGVLLQGIFSLTLEDSSKSLNKFLLVVSERLGFSFKSIEISSNSMNCLI